MNASPPVVTIRYAARLPYDARRAAEERTRAALRATLGDVLVRFEELSERETSRHTRIRFTGGWRVETDELARRTLDCLTGTLRGA
ncbi:hypothetical protein [Deinococcus pimensis]|uniref:hypothetical protein n=1 Tax=Deinococcus pimensis TaxID=309888 RepID=UPI0012F8CA67|nr:hypothetical protein [Deinococcus pimensis]